jgi:hypothetical protein
MKRTVLLMMICLSPGLAAAQSPECRTIPKSADRLACYDRASPPAKPETIAVSGSSGKAQTASNQAAADSLTPLADMLSLENRRLNAKINNICRGC